MNRLNYIPFPTQTDALQRAFFSASMRKVQKDKNKITKKLTVNSALFSMPDDCIMSQISVTLQGNSVTNVGGSVGDCEDLANFEVSGSTIALDSTSKVFGSNSIIATSLATGGFGFRALADKFKIDATKYYLVSGYIKMSGATSVELIALNQTNAQIKTSGTITNTTFARIGVVLQPSELTGTTSIKVYVRGSANAAGNTVNGDGLMVNEITAAEYALGASALLPKYNYVTGNKSTLSERLKSYSQIYDKNSNVLEIGSYTGASQPANAFVKTTNTARIRTSDFTRAVLPNTQYTFIVPTGYIPLYLVFGAKDGSCISELINPGTTNYYTFTTPVNCYKMMCVVKRSDGAAIASTDLTTVTNGLCVRAGTDTSYVAYTDTTAYTSADWVGRSVGVVKDEDNVTEGKVTKNNNVATLNGSKFTGFNSSTDGQLVYADNPITDNAQWSDTIANTSIDGKTKLTAAAVAGQYSNTYRTMWTGTANRIILYYPASTFTDLAAAQAFLNANPVAVIYQMANPIVTYYDPKLLGDTLEVGPGYTIIEESACFGVMKPNSGKMIVTTSERQIKELKKLVRFDVDNKGQLIYTDVLSSGSITDSGTSITIANADYTKNYFYDADYIDGISTVSTKVIEYAVGEDQTGSIATHDYAAAVAAWTLTGDEARATVLTCTNAGGAANIIAPNTPARRFIVINSTSYAITIKTSSGTGVSIAAGKKAEVINSGSDYVRLTADI